MPSEAPLSESARGYLSEESKRRFTIVAGVLGAVFFLAQFLLPMILMLLIMLPMMTREMRTSDLEHAVLWQGELWFVESAHEVNWRDLEKSRTKAWLKHARLSDLFERKDATLLDETEVRADPWLLPQGDRLWIIGAASVSYYEGGALTRLGSLRRPPHTSQAFLYQGRPAVITLGRSPALLVLDVQGASAAWRSEPFALAAPLGDGQSVSSLQVVPVGERHHLVVEVCGDEPRQCGLFGREASQSEWIPLATPSGGWSGWMAVALDHRPKVILMERRRQERTQLAIVAADTSDGGPEELGELPGFVGLSDWRALSPGTGLLLVSEGMPGSRRLVEIVDGKIVRSVRTGGSFPFGDGPFGGGMMAFMFVPQLLPLVLSLTLAFVLTVQMRKHRVARYAAHGVERAFASLWQRAWAQIVDALVLGAGFVIAFAFMTRIFSDPESMIASYGPWFVAIFFGLFALAFVWMLLVLVAFSYLEGRFGKTPGKWLLRIRVLGTDLKVCGFGRALVRNLLTFVDGFFNFLVGVLLVALTENWQRLGDLAARTIVVVDEKRPA
jgi:uncharacterized RDD family membrane protein YckC